MKGGSDQVYQPHHQRYQSQHLIAPQQHKQSQNTGSEQVNRRLTGEKENKANAQIKMREMVGNMNIDRFIESPNEVQTQLNALMQKYASQPSQNQGVKMIINDEGQSKQVKNQILKKGSEQQKTTYVLQDTEAEDYETLQQYALDYLQSESEMPQKNDNRLGFNKIITYQQPQVSKTPNPFPYTNMVNTPNSIQELKSSQNQAIHILNHYNQQFQHHRNPTLPLSLGFKSHNPPLNESQGLLQAKKHSISALGQTQIKGALGSANASMNQKSIPAQHKNKENHKKSQSLYNKKIVDIISGLQQSLGVIANNVKSSFHNEDLHKKQDQQKALVESAILAQKLALMTSSIQDASKIDKTTLGQKRKSMKLGPSHQTGRGSMNIQAHYQNGFKTIEMNNQDNKRSGNQSNRMSIDVIQSRGNSAKPTHQRTTSESVASNGIFHPQKLIHNTMKSKAISGTTNSSVEEIHQKYALHKSDMISSNLRNNLSEDFSNYNSNPNPISAKSGSRIEQVLLNSNQVTGSRIHQSNEMVHSALGYSNKDQIQLIKRPQTSIQTSKLQNQRSLEAHRQSLSQATQIVKIKKQGERQSEVPKKSLKVNPNAPVKDQQLLKSTASSPNFHQQNHTNQPTKSKQPSQSKSSYAFDFDSQNSNMLVSSLLSQQQKPVTTKKKNLIALQKATQNKIENHRRSTSDGSSLTKMFHFKQQMMINKIFQQSQASSGSNTANITQIKKVKQHQVKQSQSKTEQPKAQVMSSLSSKRLSKNEENQENCMASANYKSPRSQQVNQGQTQDIKNLQVQAFLRKFTLKANQMHNQQLQANEPKPKEAFSIRKQDINLYKSSEGLLPQQVNGLENLLQSHFQDGKLTLFTNEIASCDKRQSEQIRKSSQNNNNQVSHKRASSDASKAVSVTKSLAQKQQKLLFMNQPTHAQNPNMKKLLFDYSSAQQYTNGQTSAYANHIYSARASPTNLKNTYYNFDDHQSQQYQGTNTKSFLPTARSEQSFPLKQNGISNQTTLKKAVNSNSNERLIDTVNKLVYQEKAREAYLVKKGSNKDVIQSQQNNKLASMLLYGESNVKTNHQLSKKPDESMVVIENHRGQSSDYNPQRKLELNDHQLLQSARQSPKMKAAPTPKLLQPGNYQRFLFEEPKTAQLKNFLIAPAQLQLQEQIKQARTIEIPDLQSKSEFDGHHFQTFESNLTTHTMNNLTPRAKDRYKLIKQIKISFNKLKEPIKTTSEFYRIGKMLGKGAFGRVNLAIHKLCNQLVAVKSINKQFLSEDEGSKKKVMQEVLILQKTRHDNIVRLYDSFETGKHICFVMELCAGGDLLNYVRKRRKLKEEVAKYVFKQVVEGLAYCHSKGIVHRDMKLDNILLDDQGMVKICDFGVSKFLKSSQEVMTEQCGTPAYIAPEILKDKGYKGFGVDIWSLGVCLYAMLYGTVPFKANNMSELHQLILKAKYTIKDDAKPGEVPFSDEVKSLIKQLLEPNPDKRIDIKTLQQHPWLQDVQDVEIFTDQELDTIRRDFTYQDMSRYRRNHRPKPRPDHTTSHPDGCTNNGGVVTTEEPLFTEHALDSTTNALMKNCSTKSVVLAPFNSTRTHIAREDADDQDVLPADNSEDRDSIPPLDIDKNMMVDKRIIKFAPRVKDINRQYEMNNNCELDNGVYNKFLKQSQDNDGINNEDNSLVTSMNNDEEVRKYNVPLVSQNSDEEAEAEVIKKNHMQGKGQVQTFLEQQKTEFYQPTKDEQLLIDYEVVERVELFGYPRQFIIHSLEHFDMNDAATNYFLLDKEKQIIEDVML